jgi:hypothetical protein
LEKWREREIDGRGEWMWSSKDGEEWSGKFEEEEDGNSENQDDGQRERGECDC